jgi:aminopeptidase N
LQKGYPLVTVTFDATNSLFRLTQKRYLSITEEKPESDTSSWYIPLSFTTGASPNFDSKLFTDYFMDGQAEKTISISGFDASQWYIFNIQQLGYYRVNYDDNNWRRIIEILNSDDYDKIHVLNRAQLVDDALTLAFDGVISYDIALGVVSYLSRETDYIPWYPAVVAFDKLDYILKGSEAHEDFQKFVMTLIRRLYASHDFSIAETLTNSEQFAMEMAIDWTCRMGDEKCLRHTEKAMRDEKLLKPLEITYICNGLKGMGRSDEFKRHFERFQNSIYQTEQMRIIDGLLCSSDPQNLKELLYTTTTAEIYNSWNRFRMQDRRRIYSKMAERSSVGLQALTEYILEYYDDVMTRWVKISFNIVVVFHF